MRDKFESHSDPFALAQDMAFGDVHLKYDEASELKAIIAIHNTNLGPSLGGCRFVSYQTSADAIFDAMRLAQGMSYKAAISGLSLGGGKAVIIKPEVVKDRESLFSAFGDFVEEIDGRYITAVDSGTHVSDMDVIARRTKHVSSTSIGERKTGDPSPYTAFGVKRAIEAAVKTKYGSDDMTGIHVAIQGTGHVGYYLAKELHAVGARLTVSDVNKIALQKVADEFSADVVDIHDIYKTKCHVFAPCALGGAINAQTVDLLATDIVAGAANNQLATAEMGEILKQKNILYAPDYVANAGGLIQIALVEENAVREKVSNIYSTLLSIFEQAEKNGKNTAITADEIAQEIIDKAGTKSAS